MKLMSRSDKIMMILSYIVMTLALIIVVLPLMNLLAVSLSTETEVVGGRVTFWPKGFHLNAYTYILSAKRFMTALFNSVQLTLMGTAASLFSTCLAAYALSRKNLPGRRGIMLFFIFSMLFNGGIIPTYLLIMQMKLLNTLCALVAVSCVSVYNLLIMKNYFEGLPLEIEESARIDGARPMTIFFKIALPLATPVLATVGLFYAVGYWNEYFSARLYITKQAKLLLQPYLQAVIFEASDPTGAFKMDASKVTGTSTQSLINATVVCVMIPICIVYPFLQRYFVSGVVLGAVKG